MVIVLIRRCVKKDKEAEFVANYKSQKPIDNTAFLGEDLTRLSDPAGLPDAMRSLSIGDCGQDCVTYLNIAKWNSAEEFKAHFKPETTHDPEIECCDKLRATFDIVELSAKIAGVRRPLAIAGRLWT